MPPLCSVIDQMSLLSLATARFVAAKHKPLARAAVETRETKSHCYTISYRYSKRPKERGKKDRATD
jgi:hypothetical protein